MIALKLNADQLVTALMRLSESEPICLLDSCGVRHLGSHRLIAGVRPIKSIELFNASGDAAMRVIDENLQADLPAIFSVSYDLGPKLQGIAARNPPDESAEPDLFLSVYEALVIHDYDTGRTEIIGTEDAAAQAAGLVEEIVETGPGPDPRDVFMPGTAAVSNFTRSEYLAAVERIREYIRRGDTYQTNLTQKISCDVPDSISPQNVFRRLRRDHPAPFAAFISRSSSTVVSASPERFFKITRAGVIEASPIKGTRRRGIDAFEDARLRKELLTSEKDRAENTMIVDLVRNDLGRICEFGTVAVDRLCDIEEHPTLFHLVSTVRGDLRDDVSPADVLRAVFPCGSITGAPKIRTMQIIDEIEPDSRGLSMGAIGCYLPNRFAGGSATVIDASVAIRTMVFRDRQVTFNVGGGVVTDSDPQLEYDESLLKARALLNAVGAEIASEAC